MQAQRVCHDTLPWLISFSLDRRTVTDSITNKIVGDKIPRAAKQCIFCQICRGSEPASSVHSDDRCLAFLTLRQTRPGELLVIPRVHIDHFCDIPNDLAAHIMVQAQRISRAMMKVLRPPRVGLVIHGFTIPHAHLIVVPQHNSSDITSATYAYIENSEIKFDERRLPIVHRQELDALASRLRHVMRE
jgi:histidine triad (HIT) family protein